MQMYDLIYKKRMGEALLPEELRAMIRGYTDGTVPDYQMSAFLMAVCFSGMTGEEIVAMTDAMAHSGDMVDLSPLGDRTVDKHSTGGVGDKTTLIVAPIAAACGCKVAKMSGRGLGHTGGTADKLEAIDGYRCSVSREDFLAQVEKIGVAVVGTTGNLAPADKKIYALRDVTATVDSIPLIASSIMSKKLAAGSKGIVLDVKVGSGAFMKTVGEAEALARVMVEIGEGCGRHTTAVLTDMDRPLGVSVGNTLEVLESMAVLRGEGTEATEDLRAVSVTLAGHMIAAVHGCGAEEGIRRAETALSSGAAYETFCRWMEAQGANMAWIEHPGLFPRAACQRTLYADRAGYITKMDTEEIGMTGVLLGAGRRTKEEAIDYSAGMEILKKTGDAVSPGDPIAVLYAASEEKLDAGAQRYHGALSYGATAPEHIPLILGCVTGKA